MCATCGCTDRRDEETRTVTVQAQILARNDHLAAHNRDWLARRGVLAINLMGSPGAGKTALLQRTAADLTGQLAVSVIEGDQATELDAERIRSAGCRAVQVNTGAGCHLDATVVGSALADLDPQAGSVVVIENVGNLVCPALFDLGEAARVVLASVTEGTDKPAKYPHMFRHADLVVITKLDLLPYVDFDVAGFLEGLRRAGSRAEILELSALTGDGTVAWYRWLRQRLSAGPAGGPRPGPR